MVDARTGKAGEWLTHSAGAIPVFHRAVRCDCTQSTHRCSSSGVAPAEVVLEGHKGGVTQVLFGREGHYLYTGARADAEMRCWDVRAGQSLYVLQRVTPRTNQRMEFDIEPAGRHLVTGGEDGCLRGFDLRDGSEVACCRRGCRVRAPGPTIAAAREGVGLHAVPPSPRHASI